MEELVFKGGYVYAKITGQINTKKTWWKEVVCVREEPIQLWSGSRSKGESRIYFLNFLSYSFSFSLISQRKMSGTDIHECVQCVADPYKWSWFSEFNWRTVGPWWRCTLYWVLSLVPTYFLNSGNHFYRLWQHRAHRRLRCGHTAGSLSWSHGSETLT